MPPLTLAGQIDRLKTNGAIAADDVMALRGFMFGGDNRISADEAAAIVALDETARTRAPEWQAFYVEALTEFVVYQQEPRGFVDETGADWLIKALAHDGKIRSGSEIEALVHVLETAEAAPPRLAAFALAQVKAVVIADKCITAREVALIRRLLFAVAGEGNIAITRHEAETLFDINDACRGAANDPAWTDLFAKALVASVMTVSGYRNPTPEEETHRQLWLNTPDSLGAFMGRMVSGFSPSLFHRGALGNDDTQLFDADAAADAAARRAAEPVDGAEAAWLIARIGKDGVFDEGERRVIAFLRQNAPSIDPALQALIEQVPATPEMAAPFGHRGAA